MCGSDWRTQVAPFLNIERGVTGKSQSSALRFEGPLLTGQLERREFLARGGYSRGRRGGRRRSRRRLRGNRGGGLRGSRLRFGSSRSGSRCWSRCSTSFHSSLLTSHFQRRQ